MTPHHWSSASKTNCSKHHRKSNELRHHGEYLVGHQQTPKGTLRWSGEPFHQRPPYHLQLAIICASTCHRTMMRKCAKKRRAQIWSQIQHLMKSSTGLRRQTRTSNTHTKHKRRACSCKPNYTRTLSCQENCFTLDSHMLTSDSFFSLQTQHGQSQGNTNTTNKQKKQSKTRDKEDNAFPLSICLMSS